jgi:hypothetical protein
MAQMDAAGKLDDVKALRALGLPKKAEEKLVEANKAALAAKMDLAEVERIHNLKSANPILVGLDMVDQGIPLRANDGAKFYDAITSKDGDFITKTQNWIADKAAKGNAEAERVLKNWRQKAMEDLLYAATSEDARGTMINARKLAAQFSPTDIANKDSYAYKFKALIGDAAFREFQNRILPALKRIGESQQEAAQAAGMVRGKGAEEAVKGIGEAGKNLAAGQPARAASNIFTTLSSLGLYKTAAKVFSDAPNKETLLRLVERLNSIDFATKMIRPAMIDNHLMDAFEE